MSLSYLPLGDDQPDPSDVRMPEGAIDPWGFGAKINQVHDIAAEKLAQRRLILLGVAAYMLWQDKRKKMVLPLAIAWYALTH